MTTDTKPTLAMRSVMRPATQQRILNYAKAIQTKHKSNEEFRAKLKYIDEAYYRANETSSSTDECDKANPGKLEVPIVQSEVDSLVTFLSDVYLSSHPLFPVVADSDNLATAKALAAKIDEHATIGRWGRQLLLFFKATARYNIGAIEGAWEPMQELEVTDKEGDTSGAADINTKTVSINRLKNLDMYNTFWDGRCAPADVLESGEYVGYNAILNTPKLKELIQELSDTGEVVLAREALSSSCAEIGTYYNEKPIVSKYMSDDGTPSGANWLTYLTGGNEHTKSENSIDYADNYLVTKLYARVIPDRLGITTPMKGHTQIWKFVIVNMRHVIHAKRVITPFNYMPIMLGDIQEDGFGLQTQSVAESVLGYQDAATELLNVRLLSARRALGDRGLYNPKLVSKANINSPGVTAKIPINETNYRDGTNLGDAYLPIPFDHASTAGTINDMGVVMSMAEKSTAANSARQGQFRPGNRTKAEFDTIMSAASGRQRTSAILLEHQVFNPLKYMIKSNILQFGTDELVLTSTQNTEAVQLNMTELRKALVAFKVADGYTPKEQLMDPELLQVAMQAIPQIPELNQEYSVSSVFAQLMQLAGNIDIEQHKRKPEQIEQRQAAAAAEEEATNTNPAQSTQPQP